MKNSSQGKILDQKNPELLSDNEIISEVVAGNTNLFAILTERYNQQLFRVIRGYLNNEDDVKDVMQSAYIKAFENLEQFRGEAQFSTWLIRIAINEALKKIKSQKNFSDINDVTNPEKFDQKERSASTPESKVINDDMNKHLEKAIDTLPPKYRSVLIMREIEQMSTRETAEKLEITRSNVKVRLHRAKNMLRDELTDMLREIDLFSFKGEDCNQMTRRVMDLIKNR